MKFCTKRLRGNASEVDTAAVTIRDDAWSAARERVCAETARETLDEALPQKRDKRACQRHNDTRSAAAVPWCWSASGSRRARPAGILDGGAGHLGVGSRTAAP